MGLRDHFVQGESLNVPGKFTRLTENMTREQAKKWKPGIESQFYKNFKVVKDEPPYPK